MTIPAADDAVVDDTAGSRFVISEGGAEAELLYVIEGDRMLLVHTEVPEAWGGRGIGGRLVRAALARAKADRPDRGALVPVRPALAAGAPRRGRGGHHRLGDPTSLVLRLPCAAGGAASTARSVEPCAGNSQGVVLGRRPGTFDGEGATQ